MKWLIVLAALGAAALSIQILIWERRSGRSGRSPLRRLAWAVLTVVVLGAVVYVAHWLGIFSIPLVAVAFVPIGVTVRWLLSATRASRMRTEGARAAAAGPPSRRARLIAIATWPIFLVLVAVVVVLGLVVGTLVGPH
jgi:hypothetical protein